MEQRDNVPERRPASPAVVAELIGLALCLVLGVLFYCLRGCLWDIAALALWGAVALLFGILLFRAERRLRRVDTEEEGR